MASGRDAPETDFGRSIERLQIGLPNLLGQPAGDFVGDQRLAADPLGHVALGAMGLSAYDSGAMPAPLYTLSISATAGAGFIAGVIQVPAGCAWRVKAASIRCFNGGWAPANLAEMEQAHISFIQLADADFPPGVTGGWALYGATQMESPTVATYRRDPVLALPETLSWSGDVVLLAGGQIVFQAEGLAAGDDISASVLYNRVRGGSARPPR